MSAKNGNGVIIASGAETMIDIRAPYDAANISVLFGIAPGFGRKFVAGKWKFFINFFDFIFDFKKFTRSL